ADEQQDRPAHGRQLHGRLAEDGLRCAAHQRDAGRRRHALTLPPHAGASRPSGGLRAAAVVAAANPDPAGMNPEVRRTHTYFNRPLPMQASAAEGGQITPPTAVRDALGLVKGTQLKVELEGSRIVLRKIVDDAISRVRGKFKLDGFESVD